MADDEKIEKTREVRIDCTCVDNNIHPPRDSSLLWDGVRVITRLIGSCRDNYGVTVPGFHNHTRVAKRRLLAIVNAKKKSALAKRRIAIFSKPPEKSLGMRKGLLINSIMT